MYYKNYTILTIVTFVTLTIALNLSHNSNSVLAERIIQKIPIEFYPTELALNEKNGHIYLNDRVTPSILVFDGKTYSLIQNISVVDPTLDSKNSTTLEQSEDFYSAIYGDKPQKIFYNPLNGKIYVGFKGDSIRNATEIDEKSVKTMEQWPGGELKSMAFDTKHGKVYAVIGNFVYISDSNLNNLTLWKPNGAQIPALDVDYSIPNGKIYVLSKDLMIFDSNTNQSLKNITLEETRDLVTNPNNGKVYVSALKQYSDQNSTVAIVDGTSDAIVNEIPAYQFGDFVVNTNNNDFYYQSGGGEYVWIIDGKTNTLKEKLYHAGMPAAFDPTNNHLYTLGSEGDNALIKVIGK